MHASEVLLSKKPAFVHVASALTGTHRDRLVAASFSQEPEACVSRSNRTTIINILIKGEFYEKKFDKWPQIHPTILSLHSHGFAHFLIKWDYCRAGFNCENLLIVNYVFLSLHSIHSLK